MIEYTARLMAKENTQRYKDWMAVFGASAVYLVDPLPKRADLPGRPQAIIYLGDYRRLGQLQKVALAGYLAAKFLLNGAVVHEELEQQGVYPILAEDVWVFYGNAKWMI